MRLDPIGWPRAGDTFAATTFSRLCRTFAAIGRRPFNRQPCPLPRRERLQMDWSIGKSAGWAMFFMPTTLDLREPVRRYCTLLVLSGRDTAEDERAARGLRSVTDLSPYGERPLALLTREAGRPRPAEYQLIHDSLPATAAALLASLAAE